MYRLGFLAGVRWTFIALLGLWSLFVAVKALFG
jgi:hypothetical protein